MKELEWNEDNGSHNPWIKWKTEIITVLLMILIAGIVFGYYFKLFDFLL